MIKIEWSARKNRINVAKHKVDFREAATVFDDPAHASISDPGPLNIGEPIHNRRNVGQPKVSYYGSYV